MTTSRAHSRALAALALALVGFGCAPEAGRGLTVVVPSAVRQAVSDDAALCDQLAVDLTFDRKNDVEPPLLQNAEMEQTDTCTFVLPAGHEFPKGTYDLLIRFVAVGTFEGAGTCLDEGVDELWIGAYVYEDLTFPFADDFAGIREADFLSAPEDDGVLARPGVGFDVDGDGRANLAELASGSNPCKENTPPVVTVSASAASGTENEPFTIELESFDDDSVAHGVTLELSHGNGPEYGTELIRMVARTDAPTAYTLSPDPRSPGFDELWNLEVTAAQPVAGNPGAAAWTLSFTPDEPFVGALEIRAFADDGQGNRLASAAPSALTVANVPDETVLLFEDETGAFVPGERLDFAEVEPGGEATTHRFRFENGDLDANVPDWVAELTPGAPAGMTLRQDLSTWVISWAPTNDDVVNAPDGGHTVGLVFFDSEGEQVREDPDVYPVAINPQVNDAPALGDLTFAERTLPPGFLEHRIHFDFHDPDEVADAPTCEVTITGRGDTTCDEPFLKRCEPAGSREGDRWPMVIVLEPGGAFETVCGERPSFTLELTVDDVPPGNAIPATPLSAEATLELSTAEVASAVPVQGLGANFGGNQLNSTAPLIDGSAGVAILAAYQDGTRKVFALDIDADPPTVLRTYTYDDAHSISQHDGIEPMGAVDEINHRVVVFGRALASDDFQLLSFSTLPPYDVTVVDPGTVTDCGFEGRFALMPISDGAGGVWIPCGYDNNQLVRANPNGTFDAKSLPTLDARSGVDYGGAVVDEMGRAWLVWPDDIGIVAVNLSTFDDPVVDVVRLSVEADWNAAEVEGATTDLARHDVLIGQNPNLYQEDEGLGDGDAAELYRVRFENGAPEIDLLVVGDVGGLGNNGEIYQRYVLRRSTPAGTPLSEADLIVTGGKSDERVHVDLDSFTVVPGRPQTAYQGIGLIEIYESPDPRYFMGLRKDYTNDFDGLILWPWDPNQPAIEQELAGAPDTSSLKQAATVTSHTAGKTVIFQGSGVSVVTFSEAAPPD